MMNRKESLSPISMAMIEKPKSSDMYFTTGTEVEVSSNDEGFKGSWYVATIIKSPAHARRKAKALVEYHTLVSECDPNAPLQEYVDVSFIRPPPPPPENDTIFEPLDVVDAFHRDGWWKGVVSQVQLLDDRKKSKRYTVIFENPPEQFCFQSRHLRFHLLWEDGRWVRPPKQKRMEGLKIGKGMAVEVNFDKENLQDAWFPATVLEEVGFNSFVVEYDSSRHGGGDDLMKETVDSFHIRIPPPMLEIKNFQILEAVDVFFDSCWRYGTITKILTEGRYNVFIKHAHKELQFSQADLRPSLHLMNGVWVYTRAMLNGMQSEEQSVHVGKHAKDCQVVVCTENSSPALNHTEKKSPHRRSSAAKYQTEEKSSVKRLRKNPLEQSTPPRAASRSKKLKNLATESEETLASFSKKFRKENSAKPSQEYHAKLMLMKSLKKDVTDSAVMGCSMPYLDGNLPSEGSNSPCKGKNNGPNQQQAGLENGMTGSPQKRELQLDPQVTSQSVPVTVRFDKGNEDPVEVITEFELTKYDSSSSILLAERRGSPEKNSHHLPHKEINVPKESDVVRLQEQGEQHNFAEGSAGIMDFEDCAIKKAELPTAAGMEYEDHTAKEVGIVAVGASGDAVNDGQALSIFIEGNENGEVEDFNQNVQADNELVNSQEIPFVKSSSVWEHIESLEVFQFMPQKPHFSPLLECKEVAREGSAIGHMLTFAALVEKASKLQVEDPINLFDSYLEALTDLEMLGFDVKTVRDRLKELLTIKNRQQQLKNQSKDVQSQLAECDREKAKLEEEINAIEKMMKELEEKRALSTSLKIAKQSEVSALQMEANDINEAILNINQDFESLAAASW